jgi:serine/threonine protein kinase
LGKYKILRVIARSNDVVYEAIDPSINRRLAVKELALSPNLSGRQRRERIERFYREAKAAGNLTHPNIVTVFEVGQEGERHYIAMEYLEGPSLRDILRMRNNLSIKESLTVALQLADALGYAHGQGVIHRDVKPDNVHLVLPNDNVKLTDFGIARILSDPAITSTGQVFGTPSYMSPEQIMSKEVDHRTDIFSLGVVLYEMIVGRKPFTGDSVITITYHIMNTVPTIPASLPTGVFNIINRALTKDPSLRYQNMAALAADIQSELAFSDSPYRILPPGGVNYEPYSDERTQAVDKADLSRPFMQPPSLPQNGTYAPPTGISEAVSGGGMVAPAASVTPMSVPRVTSGPVDDSSRSAMALIGTVIGVVVLVLIVVFALAKAYTSNEKSGQALAAYQRANSERLSGDNISAERDYQEALDDAPPGSQIAINAKLALSETPTSPTVPNSALNGTILQPDPSLPAAPAGSSSTAPPTTPAPYQLPTAPTGGPAADSALTQAKSYQAQGDQTDAITQFETAATADPTGPSGKAASAQLAQIFSQEAASAVQNGQMDAARNDWQAIVKYAPDDPLADDARQKILQNSTSTAPPAPGGSTSPDQPVSTGP